MSPNPIALVRSLPLGPILGGGLLLGLVSGCDSGGSSSSFSPQTPAMTESAGGSDGRSKVDTAAYDAEFINRMTRFSELSMLLAELQLSNGQRPAVHELAEKIKRRESVDVAFLQAERARLSADSRGPDLTSDPQANDLRRRMQAATPAEADTLFVERMIKHRLETAKYAESCMAQLHSPNLMYYCRAVVEDSGASLRELRSVQSAEQPIPVNARAGTRGYQGSTRR
ncbi:MAG: DUF305 domain-containing protein [Phycisphaerales bacterium]